METREFGVQLGRFAPYTRGHEMVTQKIVDRYGPDRTVLLVGSTNSLSAEKTPFTFEQRRAMIRQRWADLDIFPQPDQRVEGELPVEGAGFRRWIEQLKELECHLRARFRFFCGSLADLHFLEPHFPVEVLVDRHEEGRGISATMVREALNKGDELVLSQAMAPEVLPLAREFLKANYRKFFGRVIGDEDLSQSSPSEFSSRGEVPLGPP